MLDSVVYSSILTRNRNIVYFRGMGDGAYDWVKILWLKAAKVFVFTMAVV